MNRIAAMEKRWDAKAIAAIVPNATGRNSALSTSIETLEAFAKDDDPGVAARATALRDTLQAKLNAVMEAGPQPAKNRAERRAAESTKMKANEAKLVDAVKRLTDKATAPGKVPSTVLRTTLEELRKLDLQATGASQVVRDSITTALTTVEELIRKGMAEAMLNGTVTHLPPDSTPRPSPEAVTEAMEDARGQSAIPAPSAEDIAKAEAALLAARQDRLKAAVSHMASMEAKYNADKVAIANDPKLTSAERLRKADALEAEYKKFTRRNEPKLQAMMREARATEREGQKAQAQAQAQPDAAAHEAFTQGRIGSLSEGQRKEIIDRIQRMRGPDVTVEFLTMLGARSSHRYSNETGERVIRIALASLSPMSDAYHESMHDLLAVLRTGTPETRQLYHDLRRAASTARTMARMRELLADNTEALGQIAKDVDERVAYMFQFAAEGQLDLRKNAGLVTRIINAVKRVLGMIPLEERAVLVMDMLMKGGLASPSAVHDALKDNAVSGKGGALSAFTKPLRWLGDRVFSISIDQLHDLDNEYLSELADLFWVPPDREGIDRRQLGFTDKSARDHAVVHNLFSRIIAGTTAEQRRKALRNMQSMMKPEGELETGLAGLLDRMYNYLKTSGVDIGKTERYFPRVWAIDEDNRGKFRELLLKHGNMSGQDADMIIAGMMTGDGLVDLADEPHHLGFVPAMAASLKRKLDFINEGNAAEFAPFQSDDLVHVMNTYLRQASHRGAYAAVFGDHGEKIKELKRKAAGSGASTETLERVDTIVAGLLGTLGNDMNPYIRTAQNAMITLQNLAVLPLSLLSSLLDPLGVAVRTGSMENAWEVFTQGITDLMTDSGLIDDKEGARAHWDRIAEDLGIISDQNTMDAMGYTHTNLFMGPVLSSVNDKYFRWIGMNSWNQSMRRSAMIMGMRYLREHKADDARMRELGLELGDVVEVDNLVAYDASHFGGDPLATEKSARVRNALYKFVNSAILKPNAALRPTWMSDPRFLLVAHLKSFTYSFQNVVMRRVAAMADRGDYLPASVLAAYVPAQLAINLTRGMINGNFWNSGMDLNMALVGQAVQNSGVLGIGSFAISAGQDYHYGSIAGSSFLGPTFDNASKILGAMFGDGSASEALVRTLPGGTAIRGWL